MFAKLANNRKLEEATSAKDDVAPSRSNMLLSCLIISKSHWKAILQFTCWMRSLNLSAWEAKQLKGWQMLP